MTPNQLLPLLKGVMEDQLRGSAGSKVQQGGATWRTLMATLMNSHGLRNATDFQLAVATDAVNADAELDSSGGTVYGIFVDSIYDIAGEHLCVLIADTGSGGGSTMDAPALDAGAEGGANQVGAYIKLPPAADVNSPVYQSAIFPNGLPMTTSVQVMADGEEGNAPTSGDVLVYVVYRDSTEVEVG